MHYTRREFVARVLAGGGAAGGILWGWSDASGDPRTTPQAPSYDVRAYGARGDGRTDDTAAVQRAVDAAARTGGVVKFPPATYIITSVQLPAGITLDGYGATLKRPPATRARPLPKFSRMLTTTERIWDSDTDSPLLVIRGLRLDGSRTAQGPYANFELEHAHLIFLHGATRRRGKLRALVEDVTVVENVADGVSVYTNCSATIRRLRASECFRAGFAATGGHADVRLDDYVEESRVHRRGMDVEIDGRGYGGSMAANIEVSNVRISGSFDVGLMPGSVFRGVNIRSGPGFNVAAPGSRVFIERSSFQVGPRSGTYDRILHPHDVTFRDCEFAVARSPGETAQHYAALHVYWATADALPRGQRLRLQNCRWTVGPGLTERHELYAYYAEADEYARDNRLIVEGGSIAPGYDYGLVLAQGGRVEVSRLKNAAAKPYALNGAGPAYAAEARVDGVVTRRVAASPGTGRP